jgi:excisionase family DNA binding protein
MSSNIRVIKICEYCSKDFIAKKTTTKTCSDDCAKRFYKLKKQNDRIAQVEIETAVKRKPKAIITEDEVKSIQAKQFLTLKEASLLLNVSPLTLRRWTLAGKFKSTKVGKKHCFDRRQLNIHVSGDIQLPSKQ